MPKLTPFQKDLRFVRQFARAVSSDQFLGDEIAAAARQRLARRVATGSDLVVMVLDGDISNPELAALDTLRASGKPVLLVANRADHYSAEQQRELEQAIQRRSGSSDALIWVAAAPRRPALLADGRVRTVAAAPEVEPLLERLDALLEQHGELLLAIMGSRGLGKVADMLMGSVSHKVSHLSKCTCVTVK